MNRPQHVSPTDAAQWLSGSDAPVVIDVRTPAEFAGSRVPGSINIPLDLLEKNAAEIGAHAKGDVLVVCRRGPRAESAAKLLAPYVGDRAHVLTGGTAAWETEDRPVEHGEGGAWAMDRQVRATAGALVVSGLLASTVAPKAKWLAGGIGAGLLYSGLSDSCGMAAVLSKMPWNQHDGAPTVASATRALDAAARR